MSPPCPGGLVRQPLTSSTNASLRIRQATVKIFTATSSPTALERVLRERGVTHLLRFEQAKVSASLTHADPNGSCPWARGSPCLRRELGAALRGAVGRRCTSVAVDTAAQPRHDRR